MTRASHVAPAANAAPVSFGEDGRSVRNATAAEQLTARLDRLPMTRALWIMVILLTFGGFFDGYAIGLIGALGPGLFKANIFTPTTVSFFGFTGFASFVAALFAGFFIASLFVSYIADHFGRRAIFAYSLLWFGIANFIMGMQDTANGVNIWRFISALGVGLELVTVDAYLSELVPKKTRGAAFAFLQAMSAIAFLVAYFLSWQLIPRAPFGYDGWRWVTWAGSIAAVVIWWIRLDLPESPRWLAQQGRMQEAERVMTDNRGSRRSGLRTAATAARASALSGPSRGQHPGNLQPALSAAHDHADAVQLLPDRWVLWFRGMDANPADRQGHPYHPEPGIQHDHQCRRSGVSAADHAVCRRIGAQMALLPVVPLHCGVRHMVRARRKLMGADRAGCMSGHGSAVALLRAA
jgi:hypothetical protein